MTTRNTAILQLIAAVLLIVSAVSRSWATVRKATGNLVEAGLWGARICQSEMCRSARWDNVPGADFDVVVSGYVGTVALLMSAVALAMCAAAGLRGRQAPTRITVRLLTIALVAMGWFAVRLVVDNLDPSWGAALGLGVATAALISLKQKQR